MKNRKQMNCPICGQEFDTVEPVVHFGARRHSYIYCTCSKCNKAWEIGQFRTGLAQIELKESERVD